MKKAIFIATIGLILLATSLAAKAAGQTEWLNLIWVKKDSDKVDIHKFVDGSTTCYIVSGTQPSSAGSGTNNSISCLSK